MAVLVIGLLTATPAASFPLQPGSHDPTHDAPGQKSRAQSTAAESRLFSADDLFIFNEDELFTPDNCTFEDGKEDERTDFGFWGTDDRWPSLYLIGAQKAATTTVATVLGRCGVIAFGASKETTAACKFPNEPCKELLHSALGNHEVMRPLDTDEDVAAYRSQFNRDRCEDEAYKKLSCGTGGESDHLYDSNNCESLRFQEDACSHGRFLESTPLWPAVLTRLLTSMPERLVAPSRFVAIFREPASRLLSWYNHKIAVNLATHGNSFHDFAMYELNPYRAKGEGTPIDLGKYIEMVEAFGNSSASRSQLLVLNYDFVTLNASEAIHIITRHYGLPKVITEITSLPSTNSYESPDKVVRMKCETRSKLNAFYDDYNQALYTRLEQDRNSGEAASYEPWFGQFDMDDEECAAEKIMTAKTGGEHGC